jgi:hypothetical protein
LYSSKKPPAILVVDSPSTHLQTVASIIHMRPLYLRKHVGPISDHIYNSKIIETKAHTPTGI